MLTLKEYNTKLGRLANTLKMTSTMKLVAVSKLHRTEAARKKALDYVEAIDALLADVAAFPEAARAHPLSQPHPAADTALVVVIMADRGLCGGFNNNLNRTTTEWIGQNYGRFRHIAVGVCGRKAHHYFKRPVFSEDTLVVAPSFPEVSRLGTALQSAFIAGKYAEIHLAFNRYGGILSQDPVVDRFLPFTIQSTAEQKPPPEPILEPHPEDVTGTLFPHVVNLRLFEAFLDNALGEQAARMQAMEHSTRNTEKMVDQYTLLRNKARQGAITRELIEVTSGAEALKASA